MTERNFPAFPRLFSDGRGKTLYAGFSGGADSTALLLLLLEQAKLDGFRLKAIHFEHGLRGAAGRADAAWCEAFCQRHGIPCTVIPLALGEKLAPGINVESAAREARLACWRRITAEDPGSAVALAHHADDAAETLLIRLCRGGNCSSLYALRPRRVVAGVTFLRPLLGWKRGEIERFLQTAGVADWRMDASNADDLIFRNFLRNRLLPELYRRFPPARSGLQQALYALAEDAETLEQLAEERARELPEKWQNAAFWRALPPALRSRVLMRLLAQNGVNVPPSAALFRRFSELVKRVEDGECRELPLDGTHRMCVRRDRLRLTAAAGTERREPAFWNWREAPEIRWGRWTVTAALLPAAEVPPASPCCARFDAASFPETVILRSRKNGETMTECGNPAPRRVKHLLVNAGLTGETEPPVIALPDGGICWIPGVRRSGFAPLENGTQRAVVLTAVLHA